MCNLDKCKGACCWEGDYGAPLDPDEVELLNDILEDIIPYLDQEGVETIRAKGPTQYFAEPKFDGTTLRSNGACAFLTFGEDGVAQCGIEKAWADGAIDWKKPVSCHLYPVRASKVEHMNFEALNYDVWDICSEACSLGKALKVPLYVFVKDAIIRKYGEDFWNELDDVARDLQNSGGR